MNITYKNKKTEKQCTDIKKAKKDFSEVEAKKLLQRIAFIESAESLEDIKAFQSLNFHKLTGSRTGQYSIDINGRSSPYRLILEFEGYDNTQIFSNASSIAIVQIEEVSKHYE